MKTHVVVLLSIKDKSLCREYESGAIKIMKKYGGRLIIAFTPEKSHDDKPSVDEIHHVEFPSRDALDRYRADPELQKMAELRNEAVDTYRVYISDYLVEYD